MQKILNSLPISTNTYEKNIVSNDYFIDDHGGKMCFLPNANAPF